MAVVAEVHMPGVTRAQCDALRAEVGWLDEPPTGGVLHVVWLEDDGLHGLDVWADEAALAAFAQDRIAPAMAKLGIENELAPVSHPAHEVYVPRVVTQLAS
jgi:hypothetical protein